MTTKECKIAIHLVFDFLGENSFTQTGPYITQKAYVKPSINLIAASNHQLEETENIKQATALAIILNPRT